MNRMTRQEMMDMVCRLRGAMTDAVYFMESEGDPRSAHRVLCEALKK